MNELEKRLERRLKAIEDAQDDIARSLRWLQEWQNGVNGRFNDQVGENSRTRELFKQIGVKLTETETAAKKKRKIK